jgi:hypothetical protein
MNPNFQLLEQKHGIMKKSFETKMTVDGKDLPLNNFVQETIGNIMAGFSQTLKGLDEAPKAIKVKIKRLPTSSEVDAHLYPRST